MPCSIRSLLLAVVVLSNCITWTASRHHFTHNVSGHRSRHRRQGTGLFLSASYVIPGGEGSGWGEWGEVSPCSRTCGGGVASQKRICLQIGSDGQLQCTGGDTKYFSCETQDCPAGAEDFRSIQCAFYNNESFRGIKYKWEPYTKAPSPCELNCMPHGERFYYRHKSKVTDGTRCNDDSFDVCVNGTCQPVGCDMMLGSNAREDKCRQCRGNGVNCHSTNGVLDTRDLRKGYNDMMLIPEGATSIYVSEVRPSNNYLALRAKNGTYYLNGDYHIDFPRSMIIAGALWYYERSQQGFAAPDKLRCLGPITEPLYLSLLLQDENVGIEYEYSLPSALAPRPTKKYNWVHENFTPCSVTCAGGFQTRNVTCRSSEELDIVDDGLCDEGLKPPTNQTCNTQACPAQWVEGPWSQCSKRCGKGGTRSREIRCEKIITSGFPSIVSDKECFDVLGPKPELYQECNVNASCPTWFTGPWKPCNKLCGEGKRTRQVVCYQKNAGRIEVLEDEECVDEKPIAEQSCTLQLCDGVDWVVTEWSGCDTCLSTIRTRVALCATKDRQVVNSSFCEYHPTPVLQEPCDVVPPCQVQWYATQWSKCSVECGKGVQTRQVFCGRFENESVVIVNDTLCADLPKYNDTKPCEVPKEKCPSKWYASPWSACTKECGGGEQYRRVMCLRGNVPASDCSGSLVLDSSQICNDGPCNKDEILPLNSNSTPIMDEDDEDCVDEEDYPEVGIDIDTSDFRTTLGDKMFSDGTFGEEGSGMEYSVTTDFESVLTLEDTGSGFGLTSSTDEELFVEGLTKQASNASDTDATETIDISTFTAESTVTEEDFTDDSNTTDTDYDNTDESTISTITEETSETGSSEPTGTDETSSTESNSSTETDELTELTTETESGDTDTILTEITKLKKMIAAHSSESESTPDKDLTTKTTVPPPTNEWTVMYSTKETSETEVTESLETDETASTELSSTAETDDASEFTTETESGVTEIAVTEVTDLKKKEATLSSKSLSTHDSDLTTKTTVPPPTDEWTIIDETSETSSTGSSDTSETSSTESTSSTQTEETSELEETQLTTETDSSVTETKIPKVTESSITTEPSETTTTIDMKTSEFGSSETSTTYETMKSESTESISTSSTFETESITTEKSTELELSTTTVIPSTLESSESTFTEETSESSSTLSSVAKVTPTAETLSSSTESSSEKTTEANTESTELSSTTDGSTIAATKLEITNASETTQSTPSISVTTEETTESISTTSLSSETDSSSAEPLTEKTTEVEVDSTELSSKSEVFTIATTNLEIGSSSETAQSSTSIPVTTEETTESLSTVSLSVETESSSAEPLTENTTEVKVDSTELSSTSEAASVATTNLEISSSSETTQSIPVTTEEATESVSTISLSTETESDSTELLTETTTETSVKSTDLSSTTETSTTSQLEETTELSTTEFVSSSTDIPRADFTESTTSSTELSVEGTTAQVSSEKSTEIPTTDVATVSVGTTIRDWKTAMLPNRPICKKRKLQCSKTTFGCCPDRKTAAAGPFDEGCSKPKTCKESKFRCCPDEISPALGPKYEGCPIMACAETLFGCCLSDNKTAAEGNDQEGCPPKPPACKLSTYGCCDDGETEATGPGNMGCPEYSTTQTEKDTETTSEKETIFTETTITDGTVAGGCIGSAFGCCFDNETEASGPDGQGCPCNSTKFGCCPDGVSPANGTQMEGCMASCNSSSYGCCPDGMTPAHGHGNEGCCLLYPFGCCPDNYKPADGPHLEGCGCQYARFGCCPDNVTYARGPDNKGCGCQYSTHGCCPDRHTEASGPGFDGCGCHTYQFGCCPDGITISKGPGLQGCHCQQSKYGCCGDDETAASGPSMQGCDCSSSKYGCCPDGVTEAKGNKFFGCTDIPLNRQAACSLSTDRGSCRNYSVHWYYDLEYGGCSRFWYGGCEGNGNRFTSKEECEDVCVQPSPQDSCKLPKVKGACTGYNVRWYYDNEREQCSQFVFGGCLGNANNFDSRELCQAQCEPTRTADQCSLPIDRGSCSGNFGRWGFNAETRRCEQFIWGGCEGNSNRFGSEAACVQRCNPPGTPQPQCTQPQDVGNCTDKEAIWSFSQSENRCVPFYYTGCGGNDNRFVTEQTCIDACPSSHIPDMCTLPAETGECANYRERWYFDTSEQRCRQFYYGGCGGNSNNFASQIECENRCSDFTPTTTVQPPELRTHGAENISPGCLLEKDPGPCTQMSTRWAHDYTIGKCTQFQYGGCGGNVNNFPSEENCEYYCKPVRDICQLPMLSGPCEDSIMRWFYDASTDACNQFTYGGCQGNDNRFETREDCERRCRTGPAAEAQTTTTSSTSAPDTTVQLNIDSRFKEEISEECRLSLELEECTRAGVVWYYDGERRECVAYENKETGNVCRHTGTFASEETCQRSCGAFRNINVCRYSLDPGPCQNFVSKYYFNQTSGNCHEFAYGGCHGGPNRFSSFDECLQVCRPEMDPCKQGPEPGNCLERFELWYYDYYRDSCSRFTYTGCGGNDNRFETRDDCEGRCRQRPAVVTTTTTTVEVAHTTPTTTAAPTYTIEPTVEECRTPDSLTPCGMNITAFYYDSARKVCVESDIGACRYSNSYRSEEECERKCGAFKDINVCEARLDTGPCHDSVPKFYWDFASGRCQPYAFGGCRGGANRFSSIEECEEVCGSTGPGSNDVLPACSLYTNECARLECAYGIEQRRDSDGCVRCSCKAPEVDCEPMRLECETLQCPYGVQRVTDENRCQRCMCFEDPCLGNNCTVGQQCVAIAYRDPETQEPRYSAQCRLITPEPPNCVRYNDECSRLQCGELGIQRVRTVEGCERCSCVPLQIDCEPLRHECEELKCTYGMERTNGSDGCERCRCTGPPCDNKECPEGDRCVTVPYRDPITHDTRYSAECRTVNKTGYCPAWEESVVAAPCIRECNDDADCRGVAKCCRRGCGQLCLEPELATAPTASIPYTTTHKPDLPEPPRVNHETEPEVSGTEGGKATLRCLFHGNPPPKITWTRGEITIDADEGRYRLLSDGTLEIVSLYRNDSGIYICIADNGLGTARQEVHLQVKDPVTSAMSIAGEQNAVLTGELGRPLVIRCLVYGYPPPTVYWLRGLNGPMVPFSSSLYEARLPGVLLIRRLTAETVGEYLCQAYNGVGRPATKLFVVRAYQTDDSPYISKYIVPRERHESETVRVRVIDAVTQRITTHTEGTTTTTSSTTVQTTPEPDIEFRTPVFHVAVRTHISAPQTTLTAGSELSLPCEVDGYPDPEVYWTKDNVRLVARDNLWISGTSISRLTIPHLAVSDSGVYGCHAGNAYSSHYSTVQINVQGLTIPAKCTDNPFFANCHLIVRSKFCQHRYYSVFCCKSCMEAGQLSPEDVDIQGDQAWSKAK